MFMLVLLVELDRLKVMTRWPKRPLHLTIKLRLERTSLCWDNFM